MLDPMTRPLRIEFAGAYYLVTSRGNERKAIFRDNHYHLLIETPRGGLSRALRYLNGVYTQVFNRRHKRVGHLFQGRYKAILVEKDTHLLEVCRYVMLNPVRVKGSGTAQKWKWSSYAGTAGFAAARSFLSIDWVLEQLGGSKPNFRAEINPFLTPPAPLELLA